jgi:UDP-glucose:(heptosyl)LPS alpha-1,3-glucosyltransferase
VRVALVIERMDPSRGGREASVAQIAVELARRGHEVTVLCQRGSPWSADGVEVRPLGGRGLLRVARLRDFIHNCRRAIGEGFFDVVHATLPVPAAQVYQPRGGTVPAQVQAGRRRRGPLLSALAGWAERWNLRRRHMAELERDVVGDPYVHCLAVSEMVAEEFRRHYGRTRGVRVIYNAVAGPDPDAPRRQAERGRLRAQLRARDDHPVFLTLARNFPLKGITQTIDAFARFHRENYKRYDARLVVVGRDPAEAEAYIRYADGRRVASKVHFAPWSDDVWAWYAAADVCVLLTWYDPCSRVVLEAARWGIPSITTVYNGAAEVLAKGAGIVVASPRDLRAIVSAMETLADPARRGRYRDACLRLSPRLSIERHVDELLDVYRECTGR